MVTTARRRAGAQRGALAARPRRRRAPTSTATTAARRFLLADYDDLGFNYRMTDLQGAIGCAQMDRAPTGSSTSAGARAAPLRRGARRRRLAAPPVVPDGNVHGWQAYVLPVRAGGADARRTSTRCTSGATRVMARARGARHRHAPGHARAGR